MDDEIQGQITKLIAALEARRDSLVIKLGRAEEQQAHLTHAAMLFTQAIDEVQAASALEEDEAPLPEPVEVEAPEVTLRPEGIAQVFTKEHGLQFAPESVELYVGPWFLANFQRFGFTTISSPRAVDARAKVIEIISAAKAKRPVETGEPLPLAQPKRRGRPPKNGPIDRRDILVRAGRGEGVREIARKTGHHHSTVRNVLDKVQSGVADVGKAPGLEPDNAGPIPGMSSIATPIPPARLNLPKRATKPNVDPAAFVSPIPKGIDWSFELRCDSVLARVCRVLAEGGPRSAVDLARGLRCALPAIDQAIARLGGYLNRLPNGNVALNTRVPGINDQAAVR